MQINNYKHDCSYFTGHQKKLKKLLKKTKIKIIMFVFLYLLFFYYFCYFFRAEQLLEKERKKQHWVV